MNQFFQILGCNANKDDLDAAIGLKTRSKLL